MKINKTLVLTIFSILFAIGYTYADSYDRLASELSQSAAQLKQPKVAIIPFSYVDKRKSDGGTIIAERLTTRIVKLKKLQVIERQLLESVLQELHLETTGVVDVETTKQLGKVLGVDAIITGTLLDIENNQVELNARVIKTETAEVITTSSVEIEKIWQDMSAVRQQEPQQQMSGSQETVRPVVSQPSAYTAPKPQRPKMFMDFFLGGGGGKANVTFSNGIFKTRETDVSLDLNGDGVISVLSSYNNITMKEAVTENGSAALGARLVMYTKNWGFDMEMSHYAQVLINQKVTGTLDGTSRVINISQPEYLKVNTFALLSGDVLYRFSEKRIQPYIGMGFGMTINTISSPNIFGYSGSLYVKPFSESTVGFLFRIPIGLRLVIGPGASAFMEFRSTTNTFNFTRGIKSQEDFISLNTGAVIFGIGTKF